MNARASTIFVFVVLSGCEQPADPTKFTFDYYAAHPEERAEKIARCTSDGGFAREDRTCTNARAANESQGIGSFEDLPPMGLLPPETESSPEKNAEER